jgi:hypothetical protein
MSGADSFSRSRLKRLYCVCNIWLRISETPTFYLSYELTKLFSCRRDIAVWSQSVWGVNRLLRHPLKRERCAFLLFCPGHHTRHYYDYHYFYLRINIEGWLWGLRKRMLSTKYRLICQCTNKRVVFYVPNCRFKAVFVIREEWPARPRPGRSA